MNRRKFILALAGGLVFFLFGRRMAWANKAEARIEAPENAPKDSQIVIRVTVTHNANNFFHHVEWLWIQVNDKEIARWDYTASHRPEGETFTKEIKHTVEGGLAIKAKVSCNLHGSAGEAVAKVLLKE